MQVRDVSWEQGKADLEAGASWELVRDVWP